jgi:hypothetical protein
MAKLTPTLQGRIGQKAMLYGHRWQKAFFVSLIVNIGLIWLISVLLKN